MSMTSNNKIDVNQIEQVVSIIFHLRAGTSLMSSLLDDHPNLLGTPDNIMSTYYGFWERCGHLPADELVSTFVDDNAPMFDASAKAKNSHMDPNVGDLLNWTEMGPDRNESLLVDQEAFKRSMAELIGTEKTVTRKLFFQALHVAYAEALGREVTDSQIVFGLHVPHARLVEKYLEDFPEGKFLQMVRHPISGLGSHFRQYLDSGDLHASAAAGMLSKALSGPLIPFESRSQWRGVRLEDLHKNPRYTMQKVCDWLKIPWDDALLKSTINGKQWWNNKGRPQVSGPNDVIISQKYDNFFTAFDRFRLNVLSAKRCRTHGYEVKSRYQWLVTRLLVLPLLAIPLKIEFIGMFTVRNKAFTRGDTSIDPNARSTFKRISDALHGLYLGRRVMLGIWLRSFKKDYENLEFVSGESAS